MPAHPGLISAVQPDGSEITIRLHGDEHRNWATTPDGYTLMPDAKGFWTYARTDAGGHAVASDIRLSRHTAAPAFAARGIRPAAEAQSRHVMRKAQSGDLQIDATFPTKGNRRLLMLLVNFSDTKPTYTQQDFHNFMNMEGYGGIGSFRDYYLETSFGQLDIATTVTAWINLPSPKSYYSTETASDLVRDALLQIDSQIDFKDFDNDGDGILDGLAVIHQGAGAESSGSATDIWSHSGIVFGLTFDGVQVRRYTIEPELQGRTAGMTTIGVMCHEFGHNLGAPDFYDTDYEGNGGDFPGTGTWDLMGSGAWNGTSGDRPAGINMWQRIQFGWIEPVVLSADTRISGMKAASVAPEAYRFNTTVPGDYFILENRTNQGPFDAALPGTGLIITHANEARIAASVQSNNLNVTYPQALYTVCAGAGSDPAADPDSYGWVNTARTPFPGTAGVTRFGDNTLPSAHSMEGRYSYAAINNIEQAADGTISFDFVTDAAPASPRNFKVTATRGVVNLTWDAPQADNAPECYNIFRNNEFLATVTGLSYTDSSIGNLTSLQYTVDAQYPSGLVSPYVSASIVLPSNRITQLNATADASDVKLEWDIDPMLTRVLSVTDNAVIEAATTNTFEMAHLFRADDLAIYRGFGLRRISFFPLQSQQIVKCKLIVYEAEPGSSDLKVAAERDITEFGINTWNTKNLLRSVEITGLKDLYVAVRFTTTGGLIQYVTDGGPALHGYGNLISTDGAPLAPDQSISGNVMLYATLSAPATREQSELVIPSGPEDPAADSAFPIGFRVYRDGTEIGTTSGRMFADSNVPDGNHTYAVSCIFKGGHESLSTPAQVTVGTDGVTDPAAGGAAVSCITAPGAVTVTAPAGQVTLTDISGRTVATAASHGSALTLRAAPGIYLLTTPAGTMRVLIP